MFWSYTVVAFLLEVINEHSLYAGFDEFEGFMYVGFRYMCRRGT